MDDWIKKMSHTHTHTQAHKLEYYLAIKKNEILPFAMTRMEPESIKLSEISQAEKDKYQTGSFLKTMCNSHYKIHNFKLYISDVFIVFTILWSHPCLTPEHFYHSRKKFHTC